MPRYIFFFILVFEEENIPKSTMTMLFTILAGLLTNCWFMHILIVNFFYCYNLKKLYTLVCKYIYLIIHLIFFF